MTVTEAKNLLRRRYERRGFPVTRVQYREDQFLVSFGETDSGRGKGPQGVSSIRCNWPSKEPGAQTELDFSARRRRRRK